MSLTIAYPSQTVVTTGTTVRVAELPLGVRTMPTLTATVAAAGTNVTVTLSAAAVMGATSLAVTATTAALPNRARIRFANGAQAILTAAAATGATALTVAYLSQDVAAGVVGTWNAGALTVGSMYLPVTALVDQIDAGAQLTFGTNQVTVTDYCPAGSTVLEVLPLTAAITAGATATYQALLNLSGATNATPSPQPKTVDTTTYLSGIGKEMVVTQVSATLKVEYNLQVGDRGGDVISSVMLTPAKYNREIFAQISRPNDGIYQGAAIVTQSSDTAPVQDIAKRSVDMQFQGVSFSFTSFPRF